MSGDIDNNDSQTPIITDITTVAGNDTNSYHVVTGADGAILDGFTITAGYADGSDGGGMINFSSSPTLTDVIISGNAADNGGGMSNQNANSVLTNVTINNNSTNNGNGGGISNEGGNPTLMNVIVNNNSANNGNGGGISNNEGNPVLTNVTINSNSARHGGGLWAYGGAPVLTDVIIKDNSAIYDGGGINYYGGHPTWMNITFSGNSAGGHGGGMYNRATLTLVNATFTDNSAIYGGGMENGSGSSLILNNLTFNNNSADVGGGLYNNSDFWTYINNTIFWGNTAGNESQIYNTHGIINLNTSVMQGGCHAGINCTNIISNDPLLGTLGNYGGFTQTIPLLMGSSAIDAGKGATCAPTDQRGIARPQGAQCDIGAYEFKLVTIYGNTDVMGATLRYLDSTPKTVSADSDGDYSITVSAGWSGTVTPSLTGYVFLPANRTYSIVQEDQTDQNYTATIIYQIYLPLIFNNAP